MESAENIILGDGMVLKGHLPANFPSVARDHYEAPLDIQAHLSAPGESVDSITLRNLPSGVSIVYDSGRQIPHHQHGYHVDPSQAVHVMLVSDHALGSGFSHFETTVVTSDSASGMQTTTVIDEHGLSQAATVPLVSHDEATDDPVIEDVTVLLADGVTDSDSNVAQASDALDDYLSVFDDAGATMHAPASSTEGADVSADSISGADGSVDQGLDPATLADLLDSQDDSLNADSDTDSAPVPDATDISDDPGSFMDDPTLWRNDDQQ